MTLVLILHHRQAIRSESPTVAVTYEIVAR
jgi:hypothetical protein